MGVPKFFRFISERYPCLSEVVKEYEIPEYDNFYIDANGIIHNCSHPDDDIHFRISEEDIYKNIFYYLEMLFRLIRPKKLFFIAIDGVAPRAKMNQQRSRRFRTAKEAENATKEALSKGEKLPETERFDSNCITPGTVFMEKLHRQLQYFIKKKISTDSLWQKPKIILSGHNVPGEGEHKIMDYIRYLRSQSDWDPNTRHCLHGLDADLIMLGLCTHEPHFSLLREEVKFTRHAKKKANVEETKFYLLHLSLMRDYLDLEFQSLKEKLDFPYDIERIIDDWVLMGFLVGNDFIPNLPNFHIANNALHLLYQAYIEILPTLDGYINDCGTLNLKRFEKYLLKLSEVDFDNFKDIHTDLKYFESKTGKKFPGNSKASELDEIDDEVLALARETDMMLGLDDEVDSEEYSSDEELREEFRIHKADFYKNKLEYKKVDSDVLRDQAECYVRAIQWNLSYYYTGCPSWSWFYPHHYSPYVSDVKGFAGLDFKFGPSKPFLPFQQLLAVLPAASKTIVPTPFQDLMTSPDSPIINFYPTDFETDLNGKKNDWEAVVLIPFIEESSLLDAMQPCYKYLTEEEKMRNSIKPMELYCYTPESLGSCQAPEYFPIIADNHAFVKYISSSEISLDPSKIVKGRLPGAVTGGYLGFPHLRGLEFTANLRPMKVKVFENPSRGDNMILTIKYKQIDDESALEAAVYKLMGKIVFVGWPHIQRGKVTSILTEKYQFRFQNGKVTKGDDKDVAFKLSSDEIYRAHKMTLGIELGQVDIVVYVKTVEDKRYEFLGKKAVMNYLWSKRSVAFPFQTVLTTASILEVDEDIGNEKDLSDLFHTGKEVFILESKNYGDFGKVLSVTHDGRIEIEIEIKPSPDLKGVLDLSMNTDLKYYPGNVAAQRLGMGGHLFSRATGSIFIQNIENEGKLNVGLGLKFTKQGEEVVGFTKKDGNQWLYSEKTIALLDDYMAKFPELFEYLEKNTGNDVYFNKDVFPENTKEKVTEVKQWLKSQPHSTAERVSCGAKLLSNEAMKEVEKRILDCDLDTILRTETVVVHPSKLYIPSPHVRKAPPDASVKMQLLDRVVSIRKNHTIPVGLTGTIIGFDKPNSEDALYDILFDKPVIGGKCLACDEHRIYRLPYQSFINISHGKKNLERVSASNKPRMENYYSNKEDWRSPNMRNSFRNEASVSLPSPNGEHNPSIQQIGNNKVKQFFDGYMNSGKVVTPPGGSRPLVVTNSNHRALNDNRQGGADFEFQAIWNVLQNHNLPDEKSLRPQVPHPEDSLSQVEQTVSEQTNALRKILKLSDSSSPAKQQSSFDLRPQIPSNILPKNNRPSPINTNKFPQPLNQGNLSLLQANPCGHASCSSELINLCSSKGIPFPLFNYTRIPSSGEMTCTVIFFGDYGTVVGDSFKTKEEATDNASCKAVRYILQKEDGVRPVIPTGIGFRYQPPGLRQPASNIRIGMNQLPTPPMQWCPTRKPMVRVPEKHLATNNRRSSPRGPTPTNQKQMPTVSSLEGSSSNCDDRTPTGVNKPEADWKSGGEVNQTTRTPQQVQQNQPSRRPFRGKPRPRIAANFSVPLSDNKST